MDAIEAILVKAAEEIFNDMRSDSTMSRLRMLYSGALAAAAPDEINDAVSDIVRYESDNKLSTQMILDSYDAPRLSERCQTSLRRRCISHEIEPRAEKSIF